ncbi:MAG TPA: hypothetical protein VLA49_14410 [Anaerolineales bacterium]|nr:hypothetical protein [Anaerolineales bacterium]
MPPVPFLTIFSAPKPFTNPHIALIQRNAIQSWLGLGAQVEVLLVGEEEGLAQAAQELGVCHLPEVTRNEPGTPLVSSIFALAREHSQSPLMMYTNADMLFLPDLLTAAEQVWAQVERFLIVGRRWDLDISQALDFSTAWAPRLHEMVRKAGSLHQPAGSDYFVFPRECFTEIPAFAIGRAGWDNWMIYHARQQSWSTVDATSSITAIHQNHDYSHLPGNTPHYNLQESEHNIRLAGGIKNLYLTLDSDKELVNGQLRSPRPGLMRLARKAELQLYPHKGKGSVLRKFLIRRLRRLRRAIYQGSE